MVKPSDLVAKPFLAGVFVLNRPTCRDELGFVSWQAKSSHCLNMVLPFPRKSVTACFTRAAMAASASPRYVRGS